MPPKKMAEKEAARRAWFVAVIVKHWLGLASRSCKAKRGIGQQACRGEDRLK
jgi:hypothetical protein